MKKIVFKRPRVDIHTNQPILPELVPVFSVDSEGYLDNSLPILKTPINIGDSFIIEDDVVPIKRHTNTNDITNKYWVLLNPLNGNKKYIPTNLAYDIFPIKNPINNKNKVQYITSFDGDSDLSNLENLDSGFDGFFN